MRNGSLCSCQHIPGDDPNCRIHPQLGQLISLMNEQTRLKVTHDCTCIAPGDLDCPVHGMCTCSPDERQPICGYCKAWSVTREIPY